MVLVFKQQTLSAIMEHYLFFLLFWLWNCAEWQYIIINSYNCIINCGYIGASCCNYNALTAANQLILVLTSIVTTIITATMTTIIMAMILLAATNVCIDMNDDFSSNTVFIISFIDDGLVSLEVTKIGNNYLDTTIENKSIVMLVNMGINKSWVKAYLLNVFLDYKLFECLWFLFLCLFT